MKSSSSEVSRSREPEPLHRTQKQLKRTNRRLIAHMSLMKSSSSEVSKSSEPRPWPPAAPPPPPPPPPDSSGEPASCLGWCGVGWVGVGQWVGEVERE